jgi:hypothetical protein
MRTSQVETEKRLDERREKRATGRLHKPEPGIHFVMECQSDEHWRWRLMDSSREAIALGLHGFATKQECRDAIQKLVGISNVPIISRVLSKGCTK